MLDQFPDETELDAAGDAPKRKRRGRRVLVTVIALLLVPLLAIGGYVWFLSNKIDGIVQDDLLGVDAPAVVPEGSDSTGKPAKPLVTGMGENYLVIGSDARPGDTFSRSDVIIFAHVTKAKDKVYLIHFPRDLYVSIPGRGKNKINASYAFGGAPLLAATLQSMLGVKFDHAAKIDFEGFTRMTDAVGGVRVWAEEPSTSNGLTITKGWNDLDGAQALLFVRERYSLSEGDISRGRRQMAFIKALLVKTLTPGVLLNPMKLTSFMDAAIDNLVVDKRLTPKLMRSEALAMRNVRGGDIVFVTAPFTGYGTAPDGGAIDLVDEARMEQLGLALQKDDLAGYVAAGP
ncbi:MAG: LCP family protein [Tetrasphaera sp.]